jgi:tRNA A37 threonylcarbamoyladenosine synthetase subunit TsaC/SUA5/YrdC
VILEATREVPRRLSHPSRKTIGLRVPENAIPHALLEELGQPLLGTTLILPGDDGDMLNDDRHHPRALEKQVDLIIDGGACTLEPTTVIDLTGRTGAGAPGPRRPAAVRPVSRLSQPGRGPL